MARRQHRDSEQEALIERSEPEDKGFDAKKHRAVPWKPVALRKGDRIVTQRSATGSIVKTQLVREIEHEPRGCREKVHVNGQDCYDYASNDLEIALHA